MLKLSKKVDYGLMSLMHLAQRTERASWSAREIAENYDIPLELLAKILQKLVQKGLAGVACRNARRLFAQPAGWKNQRCRGDRSHRRASLFNQLRF